MATRAVPAPLAQLPNALTVLRLALIPVFVVLAVNAGGDASWPAGIVFGVAGITDQVDGWLARRWNVESQFLDRSAENCTITLVRHELWEAVHRRLLDAAALAHPNVLAPVGEFRARALV